MLRGSDGSGLNVTKMSDGTATASAAANIALVKYWGKKERGNNQPATASVSIGLEDLRTQTTVSFAETNAIVSGLGEAAETRMLSFIEDFRTRFEIKPCFRVETSNNFPSSTGLASSASGFAALTLALDASVGLDLSKRDLSAISLTGSGSAARSIYGGFVEVIPADEAYAISIMDAHHWPLDILIAITLESEKPVGSSEAMKRTAETSPYYGEWLKSHVIDMNEAKSAIADRDIARLADITEHNCLKMHATIMTTQPGILYWLPATLAVMHEVRSLRAQGIPAFFTIDAGSQVKVVCDPAYTDQIERVITEVPGVLRTIRTRLGGEPLVTRS